MGLVKRALSNEVNHDYKNFDTAMRACLTLPHPFPSGWTGGAVAFTLLDHLLCSTVGGEYDELLHTGCDCAARRRRWSRPGVGCCSGGGVRQGSHAACESSPSGC